MIEFASIDGFVLHDVSGDVALSAFEIGVPVPRAVAELRPHQDGTVDVTELYGPRLFPFRGIVRGDTLADMWANLDDMKGRMALGSERLLVFRRQGLSFSERAVVRLDGTLDVPLSGSAPTLRFGGAFIANDPRIYTETQSIAAYDPTADTPGGLTFPLTFPLDFGGVSSGSLVVTNVGNYKTPPVFVITGPVVNPIVDNDSTGQSIYFRDTDLPAGAEITVDVQARSVRLGATSRPDLFDASRSDWWELAPGANQLRLRGGGMASGQTEFAVTFRSARI